MAKDNWKPTAALREALAKVLALEIYPISHESAGAQNGKQLIRAHAIARAALAQREGGQGDA